MLGGFVVESDGFFWSLDFETDFISSYFTKDFSHNKLKKVGFPYPKLVVNAM